MASVVSKEGGDELGMLMYESSDEVREPIEADVVGFIPLWLKGIMLRVGPGKFEWGNYSYKHWFDGEGLLHKFDIRDGKAWFSSRFVQSMSYLESQRRGCPAFTQFGTNAPPDPCKNIFARFFSYFLPSEMTDNCNVNIVTYGENILTSTESTRMCRINPKSLETVELVDVSKTIGEPRSWTAHPHYEADGTGYNISTRMISGIFDVVRISKEFACSDNGASGLEILGSIKNEGKPGYYHSFAMTENYFILLENPLYFANLLKFFAMKVMNWSFVELMYWDNTKKTKLMVIDKRSGELKKTHFIQSTFVFHNINAFERGNDIVLDVCGYNDPSIIQALYLHELRRASREKLKSYPELRRYCIPLDGNEVSESIVKDDGAADYELVTSGFELPRINYAYNAKPYTYAYGLSPADDRIYYRKIVKVNVNTKVQNEWADDDCYPSEPLFVPCPEANAEDDGVVLSLVLGTKGKKSFLLVLDGKSFEEVGRATVDVPLRPLIHGEFICT